MVKYGKNIYSCFSLHFKGTVGMFVHHLDLSSCLSVHISTIHDLLISAD